MAVKIESLFILDDETKFLTKDITRKKDRTVSDRKAFNKIIESQFEIKNVIILAELDWNTNVSQFYGYEIARELMESHNRVSSFSLLFISTLKREIIYQVNKGKNRVFTQKFSHEHIAKRFDISKVKIPEFSLRKFDYLKNYCLIKSGIIDRIQHDVKNLIPKANAKKLIKVVQEIEANKGLFSEEILDIVHGIKTSSNNSNGKKVTDCLNELNQLLLQLMSEINIPEEREIKKSHSAVMLVEDEEETLDKLKKQFGKYFHAIETFKSGTQAYKELEENAKKYDVLITDMELLNGDFDDEFQGVDILELCENEYPFIVTRVITSLPRNALKKLIGKKDHEIIYKSITPDSVFPPFENLPEFVKQIDNEVKKRKPLRNMPGPDGSWWGKFLTRELYLTKINDPNRYTKIWNNAIDTAKKFIDGEFDNVPSEKKLAVKFKQVRDTSHNPQSGWEIIELLLTHRLIAIWFAAKNNWAEFYYSGQGKDAYINQKGFQLGLRTRPSRQYFNSLLGFSASGMSPKSKPKLRCKLKFDNLFPEEMDWLSQQNADSLENTLVLELNEDFQQILITFFHKYDGTEVSDGIKYGEMLSLLSDFKDKYKDEILDSEEKYKKHAFLKSIFEGKSPKFERSLQEFYERLPSGAKTLIDEIREEIFGA